MKVINLDSPETQGRYLEKPFTIHLVQSPVKGGGNGNITIGHKRFTYQRCIQDLQGTNVSDIVVNYVGDKVDWQAVLYLTSRCRGNCVLSISTPLYNKASGILYEDLCSKRITRETHKKVLLAVSALKINKGE